MSEFTPVPPTRAEKDLFALSSMVSSFGLSNSDFPALSPNPIVTDNFLDFESGYLVDQKGMAARTAR